MHKERTDSQPQLIAWQRGQTGSYILNVDGRARTNFGIVGIGGLIRDSNAKFMCGFHDNIRYSNILHA